MQLLQRNPDAAPREEAVRMQVRLFIESLAKILAAKPKKATTDANSEDQSVAKLFEEVKAMVRELPQRVDDRVRVASRRPSGRNLRNHGPKIFDEIMYRLSKEAGSEGQGVALLVLASSFKEDVPWLYEMSMQIYQAIRANDRPAVIATHKQLLVVMELMVRSPIGREFTRDDEDSFLMLRYVPEFVDRLVMQYLEEAPRRRATKSITAPAK